MGAEMLYYHLFFRSDGNDIIARHETPCADDAAAIAFGRGRLALSGHRGVEIWEKGRLVYVSPKRSAAAYAM